MPVSPLISTCWSVKNAPSFPTSTNHPRCDRRHDQLSGITFRSIDTAGRYPEKPMIRSKAWVSNVLLPKTPARLLSPRVIDPVTQPNKLEELAQTTFRRLKCKKHSCIQQTDLLPSPNELKPSNNYWVRHSADAHIYLKLNSKQIQKTQTASYPVAAPLKSLHRTMSSSPTSAITRPWH